jgi:hypothetical protein
MTTAMAILAEVVRPPPLPSPWPEALSADGEESEDVVVAEEVVRVEVSWGGGGRVDVTMTTDGSWEVESGGGKEVDVMVVSLLVVGISDDVVGGSSVTVESGMDVVTMLEVVMVETDVMVDESSVLVTVDSEVTSVTVLVSDISSSRQRYQHTGSSVGHDAASWTLPAHRHL